MLTINQGKEQLKRPDAIINLSFYALLDSLWKITEKVFPDEEFKLVHGQSTGL